MRQIGVKENVTQGRNQQGSKVRVQGQPNRHQEEAHGQGPGEGRGEVPHKGLGLRGQSRSGFMQFYTINIQLQLLL